MVEGLGLGAERTDFCVGSRLIAMSVAAVLFVICSALVLFSATS